MQTLLPQSAIILVVVTPDARDLEIARILGWYRIPLRFAPKIIEVDYLAFYQTAAFGEEHRWMIELMADVRGHELVQRKDLFRDELNHPRANEEYYKIQIGSLQPLDHPIRAEGWRRVTFLYTTGDLLIKAATINDLVVRSDEREVLWRNLRERALHSNLYRVSDLPDFPIDPMLLAMLGDLSKLAETPIDYDLDRNSPKP